MPHATVWPGSGRNRSGPSRGTQGRKATVSVDVLGQLSKAGVSVWLDDISRDRLRTGNLQALIDDITWSA